MLFKSLAPLLGGAVLSMTFAAVDAERHRVTITRIHPKKKGDDDEEEPADPRISALDKPIVVTGTLDELDVDLPAKVAEFSATRTSLADEFARLSKELEEAKESLQKEKDAAAKELADLKKRPKPSSASSDAPAKASAAAPAANEPPKQRALL